MSDEAAQFSGTMEVRDQHRFDVNALANYLKSHIANFRGPLEVAQFKGGQSNPSYLLTTPERKYVLRRKPPGQLLPSAHAIDREYRVMTALARTNVPVPKTYCLCEDEDIIGTAFYVMEFVDGRIEWDPSLPGYSIANRVAVFDSMNAAMAALHMVDYKAIGLENFGKPTDYIARQVNRWTKQYRASETETIEEMENLIKWLPDNIPPSDETALVHGDYRLDNTILDHQTRRVTAVLDWELATLGHPIADFSYHCMTWRLEPQLFRGLKDLDLPALGIPTEEQYVKMYCERTGRDGIENWDFYFAYNMFRLAAILQGIVGRVKAGTASNENAAEVAEKVRPLAKRGWEQAEKVMRGG